MPSSQGTDPEKPRKTAGNGADRGLAQQSGIRVFQNSPTGSAQDIHRSPPHSVEAEQGVLGSMLIAPQEAIPECVEKIKEEYFYVAAHLRRKRRSGTASGRSRAQYFQGRRRPFQGPAPDHERAGDGRARIHRETLGTEGWDHRFIHWLHRTGSTHQRITPG